MNNIRYIASDESGKFTAAAIIEMPIKPEELAKVYRRLPGDARQQVALAKKWKVWAVLSTNDWAKQNQDFQAVNDDAALCDGSGQ